MRRALIGHTGFVGGNLRRQTEFTDFFNSKNVEEIAGGEFEIVVCAGAPAVKWLANKEPEQDAASLARLQDALESVHAREFVLISTVDVYPTPIEVDEDTLIDQAAGDAYGRHRRGLEDFVRARFGQHLVARLPALFGRGLKKNVIFDFLHDNRLDLVHQGGVFQFYCLDHLWADLLRARETGLELINISTEPISVSELASGVFGREFTNDRPAPAPRYDFRTKHGALWGKDGLYQYDKRFVLDELRAFRDTVRSRV